MRDPSVVVPMTSVLRGLGSPNGCQWVRLNTRTKIFKREGLVVQREIKIPLAVGSQDEKAIPLVIDILYFRQLFYFGKWSPTADLFPFLSLSNDLVCCLSRNTFWNTTNYFAAFAGKLAKILLLRIFSVRKPTHRGEPIFVNCCQNPPIVARSTVAFFTSVFTIVRPTTST